VARSGADAIATEHYLRMQLRTLTLATLVAACTAAPPVAPAPPTATAPASTAVGARSTASARASVQLLLGGEAFTMTAEQEMFSFFADRGSIVALATRGGPAPYLSTIKRAEPAEGAWRTVFEDDASFMLGKVAGGRMALVEYRAPPPSTGAYDETIVVIDLKTGEKKTVDHFALSGATFRGGGGGARRAVGGLIALGTSTIAWTHLSELSAGVVEAELRVASLADLGRAAVVGRSREWIEPISVDDRTLVYVFGGSESDELRARDLATGRERALARPPAPTQSAGRDGPLTVGAWVGWIEHAPIPGAPGAKAGSPTTTTFRAVSLESGEARERVLGTQYCQSLTANAGYLVWDCGGNGATLRAFDPRAWKDRDIVGVSGGRLFGVAAVDGGFIWYDALTGRQQVTLLTPTQ
jgi:hypothetical protein